MVRMSSICGAIVMATSTATSSPTLAAPPAGPAPMPVAVAVDREQTVHGIEVACTGIGSDIRADPRWRRYGVRIEFSNARNEYLIGGAIRLRDRAGQELLSLRCDAPWILLRLPDGVYQVEGRLPDLGAKPRSSRFRTPAPTPLRVVLQFLDL